MFVRIKKIKGKKYGYLVENEWTPWGSRQKVSAYLGKVIAPAKKSQKTAEIKGTYEQAIKELIRQELLNHGFEEQGNTLQQGETLINLLSNNVKQGTKNAVIEMNEGHLCNTTMEKLLNYRPEGQREKDVTRLASRLLEAGLKIDGEQFAELILKIFKPDGDGSGNEHG